VKQFKNDFHLFEGERIIVPESWRRLQKLTEKWGGVFMVIGGVSSGKSTFVKFLASSFLNRDKKIAIIDADIGQSWIGPPTTVSAILLPMEEKIINFMRPNFMEFFGALSPSVNLNGYLLSVKKIFERVKKENPFAIIVDTTGLISGNEGLNLKLKKAEILSPTMITVFKKNGEIDPIVNALIDKKFNVYVLNSPKETRERSMNQRKEYREQAFRKYFEGAKVLRLKTEDNFDINTLVGILDDEGRTLALGIVLGQEKNEIFIYTPLEEIKQPFFLKKSHLKISLEGREV
jgi:polynucleotide 5'-hydroxyl-kinase GRC3/NOL9